jgi:hypothetical protein
MRIVIRIPNIDPGSPRVNFFFAAQKNGPRRRRGQDKFHECIEGFNRYSQPQSRIVRRAPLEPRASVTLRAGSPRSVKLLKGIQGSREALQKESAGTRFAKSGPWGVGQTAKQLGNAPQLPLARVLPEEHEHVVPFEPLGLGLKIIRDILLEILQRHDHPSYAA